MEGCQGGIRVSERATGANRGVFQNFQSLWRWVRRPPLYSFICLFIVIKILSIFCLFSSKLAHTWVYDNGIRTLEDVAKLKLSKTQLLGLKYYKDLEQKIPRSEMLIWQDILRETVNEVNPDVYFEICGSLFGHLI
jgi:hypothetical protein